MTGWPDHIFRVPGNPNTGNTLGHIDLNGDNLQDLLYAEYVWGNVKVFLNGNYSDTLYDAYYHYGYGNFSVQSFCNAGDTNGDGIEDLAMGQSYDGHGRVHLVKGSSSLHQSGTAPIQPPALPRCLQLSASPNPFNPSTALSYELPATSQVKLSVWDITGRLINTLINERQLPGAHTVIFDGSNLPSGLYLARLSAGEMTITRKLVLLK